MRPCRLLRLLSDFYGKIRYHPGKIHETRVEALKKENVKDENLYGMDKEFENRLDGTLYTRRRSWLPRVRDLGELVQHESFKILAKVGMLTYRLKLPKQLSRVHSTFHVSNLKKCFVNEPLAIPLDEIQIDDKLNFIEEPVKIKDREVKRLKQSRIPIVKVHWNSRRGPKFTWEHEDQMKKKYPRLFVNPLSTS
ncbi:hypothetical protein Tco_0281093 [Tanacetum coccineum]